MNIVSAAFVVAVLLLPPIGRAHEPRPSHADGLQGPIRVLTSAASSTVLSTLMSRDGELVLLVLWRGSPGWMTRGGRAASQSGGDRNSTWVQLTRGALALDVDVDHVLNVARVLGKTVPLKNQNVVLVDAVDAAPVVGTAHVNPAVPDTPDALFALLRRESELVKFLQCSLMRSDPFLSKMLAAHPCFG